jgi:hypothetical protein
MKILKKIGLAVVLLVGIIVGLAMFLPNTKVDEGRKVATENNVPSSATQTAEATAPVVAQTVPEKAAAKPAIQRAPDECIDGICIGAHPSELPALKWVQWPKDDLAGLAEMQKDLLAMEEKNTLENCVRRQDAWGNKADKLCKTLAYSSNDFAFKSYKPLQTADTIAFFSSDQPHVCPFTKEPFYVSGYTDTPSGRNLVRMRLDSQGVMRVYSITKEFKTDNAATSTALVEKLKEKHPYLSPEADRAKTLVGATQAGTKIELNIHNNDPIVTMNASEALFDATKIAACNAAKAVSVQ